MPRVLTGCGIRCGRAQCQIAKFGSVVIWCAKHNVQGYASREVCLPTRYYTSECGVAALNARSVELHLVKSVLVDEVEAAASVHHHFSQPEIIYTLHCG